MCVGVVGGSVVLKGHRIRHGNHVMSDMYAVHGRHHVVRRTWQTSRCTPYIVCTLYDVQYTYTNKHVTITWNIRFAIYNVKGKMYVFY